MSQPSFAGLSRDPRSLAIPSHAASTPLENPVDVLVPLSLTEEELALDEQRDDPLVPIATARILDLGAYWGTGMRGALPQGLIRRGVLARVEAVANSLPDSFGLAVFDAYRPLSLQRKLYSAAYSSQLDLPPGYVAVPSENPLTPPPHVTGGALDLTLTYEGQALSLGTDFDDFSPLAATMAFEGSEGVIRDLRRMLVHAMVSVEFVPHPSEWWHFEFGTGRWAAVKSARPLFGQPMVVADE